MRVARAREIRDSDRLIFDPVRNSQFRGDGEHPRQLKSTDEHSDIGDNFRHLNDESTAGIASTAALIAPANPD